MPKQRLYYEYVDRKLVPYWYVLTFEPAELNWDKPVYYFEAIKPIEFTGRDEFDEFQISMSIYLSDFIFNNLTPEKIGINLKSVKKRIERYGVDPYVIRQFIVSASEVSDLINFLPKNLAKTYLVG